MTDRETRKKEALKKLRQMSHEQVEAVVEGVAEVMALFYTSEMVFVLVPDGDAWFILRLPIEYAGNFMTQRSDGKGEVDLVTAVKTAGKRYASLGKVLYAVKKADDYGKYFREPDMVAAAEEAKKAYADFLRSQIDQAEE